jgi:hypothetical protein
MEARDNKRTLFLECFPLPGVSLRSAEENDGKYGKGQPLSLRGAMSLR